MLDRYGTAVHRRARLVLLVSTLIVIAAAAVGFRAFGKLSSGGFTVDGAPSTQAEQLIDSAFPPQDNLVVLVEATDGTIRSVPSAAAGQHLVDRLRHTPDVSDVVSYWETGAPSLISRDGRSTVIVGRISDTTRDPADTAGDLQKSLGGDHGPLRVTVGGDAAVDSDLNSAVGRSLGLTEAIAVPATLILLVLAFGSVVAALLPLVIGLVAIVGTFGELFVLASLTDVSIYAVNLATALGLGLGIDYALLLVARFREGLAAGDDTETAVRTTVRTAGRTIIFSACTVAVALAAPLIFPTYSLRSFAYAGIGVVVIAAVAALVVVPALLSVLGHRVDKGRLPWYRTPKGGPTALWGRLAGAVMRRPVVAAVPVLALLVLLAWPLSGVRFGIPDQGVLPTTSASRHVADMMTADFHGADTLHVVTTGPVAENALAAYTRDLSRIPGVTQAQSGAGAFTAGAPVTAAPDPGSRGTGGVELVTVTGRYAEKSPQALDLVRAVRATPAPGGVSTLVGGADAQLIDTTSAIGARLPYAAGLVVLTTLILLFLFTGSVVQPLRAVVFNSAVLAASLGAMTWVFQGGHLGGLLGFTARPMDTSMSVLLACLVFGISMDYEVFVTSRIKELHDRGVPPREAVTHGLGHTGRIVSTAAGLLAVTFFAFGTATVSFLQMLGLGCGLAVILDATLVRGVLVPVFMRLFGARAWYAPGVLRRAHRRVGLADSEDRPRVNA